ARGRQRGRRAGRQEDPPADHRGRRAARVVDAGVRGQEGRGAGLRERGLVHGDRDRHVSGPVRGALRAGPRVHADRRQGRVRRRVRGLARGAARADGEPRVLTRLRAARGGALGEGIARSFRFMSTTAVDVHGEHHGRGFVAWALRWITTTNHKDIGTLSLVFSVLMFFIGGAMALVIRAELFQPGLQFVEPQFFNQMTTMHALIMLFGMIMPAFAGFANWMVPLMIGAPDMALPRLNNWSFWLLPFAAFLLLVTFFMPGGGPASGWTMYPPLVLQTGAAFPFLIFAVHLLGFSSIMASINIIVTIMNMRAPGMPLMKMPMFVWSWL